MFFLFPFDSSCEEDVESGEKSSVGLISYLFEECFHYFIEHLLEVFFSGLFSIDKLEFGRKLGEAKIDIFEVHL